MTFISGSYKSLPVRAATILTNAYVAGAIIGPTSPQVTGSVDLQDLNQLVLYVNFTIGSLTDAQIKIEFSDDATNYFQETADSAPVAGVITESTVVRKLTATGLYRIALPIKDKWIKVSAIGTGTVTSSSMDITALVGVA